MTIPLLAITAAEAIPHLAVILGGGVVSAVQFWTLQRRTRQAVPAAGLIIVAFNVVGCFGYLFYRAIQPNAQVSANLPQTETVYHLAGLIFTAASLATWAGGMLAPRPEAEPERPSRRAASAVLDMPGAAVVAIGSTGLICHVLGYTPAGLIERPRYLITYGPEMLVSAGSLVTPISIGILACALFDVRRTFGTRFTAGLLLPLYAVVLFSMGTRQLSLFPVLLTAGLLISHGRRGPRRLRLPGAVLVAAATVILLQLPLTVRGAGNAAGWAPFSGLILEDPSRLFDIRPAAIFGNVLFAVPLAGTIYETVDGRLPLEFLMTSISPVPGRFTDWAEIQTHLGLNQSTPYSGLGELAAYGWTYLVGYAAAIGWVLSVLQRAAANLPDRVRVIAGIAVLGVSVTYALDMLQYNLRSGLRPVYYLVALVAVLQVHATLRAKKSPVAQPEPA